MLNNSRNRLLSLYTLWGKSYRSQSRLPWLVDTWNEKESDILHILTQIYYIITLRSMHEFESNSSEETFARNLFLEIIPFQNSFLVDERNYLKEGLKIESWLLLTNKKYSSYAICKKLFSSVFLSCGAVCDRLFLLLLWMLSKYTDEKSDGSQFWLQI